MKKVIWKYEVSMEFTLLLPAEAQVLSVSVQDDEPHMWVLLDAHAPAIDRRFISFETGEHINPVWSLTFIGTYVEGRLVYHLFEIQSGPERPREKK